MQADDEKMFLENIEEFVMDEGKIVTYKWLSATLDLHVNTAKQLLYHYAMPNNKKKDGVHMTYLVAGTLADGSGIRFQIVRENDLDNAKSKFNLITSEHVYSVQKASHLPDLNILYGVDNLKNEKNYADKFGAIRCSKAVQRLENDIKSLQIKARAATAVVPNSVPSSKKASVVTCSDKEKSEPVGLGPQVPIGNSKTKESEPTKSVDTKSSNSPSIASLFTAQTKASKSNDKAVPVASNNKPAAKKAKGGGIAMFFTKQSEKQTINTEHKETLQDSKTIVKEDNKPIHKQPHAEETVSTDNKNSTSTKEKLNVEMDSVKEKSSLKSDMKEKKGKSSKIVETNSIPKQTSSSKRGKKKKPSENSQPVKKRKRIMVISDDSASDEDIFGSDSDTEIRPPSPEILPQAPPKSHSSDEDMIPSTPISQQIRNGKMRKRKLIEKTFEDKDGFIMTKKEFVFESCSEDDGDNDKQACTGPNQIPVAPVVENDKPNNEIKDVEQDVEIAKPSKKQAKGEKQTKKKKALPPPPVGQKSKQSTLMSFFNKN